eukprot:scaffold1210_cov410-Prasinococcus_capsulatus_cf.AAC.12
MAWAGRVADCACQAAGLRKHGTARRRERGQGAAGAGGGHRSASGAGPTRETDTQQCNETWSPSPSVRPGGVTAILVGEIGARQGRKASLRAMPPNLVLWDRACLRSRRIHVARRRVRSGSHIVSSEARAAPAARAATVSASLILVCS